MAERCGCYMHFIYRRRRAANTRTLQQRNLPGRRTTNNTGDTINAFCHSRATSTVAQLSDTSQIIATQQVYHFHDTKASKSTSSHEESRCSCLLFLETAHKPHRASRKRMKSGDFRRALRPTPTHIALKYRYCLAFILHHLHCELQAMYINIRRLR